ncbi:hypothetical protein LSAT2_019968 [Lamellibrachia satsuma]|nr:hypothetical protein LSAT2_019968 [Lamellibrachia satsuma]
MPWLSSQKQLRILHEILPGSPLQLTWCNVIVLGTLGMICGNSTSPRAISVVRRFFKHKSGIRHVSSVYNKRVCSSIHYCSHAMWRTLSMPRLPEIPTDAAKTTATLDGRKKAAVLHFLVLVD